MMISPLLLVFVPKKLRKQTKFPGKLMVFGSDFWILSSEFSNSETYRGWPIHLPYKHQFKPSIHISNLLSICRSTASAPAMQIDRLCFVLPVMDDDEAPPFPTKEKKPRHRSHCAPLFRPLFRKLSASKWNGCRCYHFHVNKASGVFHDTDGVQLSEKVGGHNPRIFSFSELYIGSKGFSDDEILGSGGFGKVYRAKLPSDGSLVAVKCLAERGERFEKTFEAELVAVAHLRHRNLVRLRGWCVHDDQLFLVYDYMPNRSLDRVLFRRPEERSSSLNWKRRRNIVRGLAAGLFYLHEQLETQIIHRDVKTSNVMLDSNFNARLGDFGLARWLEHELQYKSRAPSHGSHRFRLGETTRNGGTIGYLPPESFQKRSVATAKSDVFSFGIVVLEVVSGRRAVDLAYPDEQIILLDWIRRLSDERKVLIAVDNRLPDGSYKLMEMDRLIHLGLLCSLHSPESRPNMKWIIEVLSDNLSAQLPNLPPFQSHPQYISLKSPTDSSSNTGATSRSSATRSSTIDSSSSSSIFVTANGESLFLTAENGDWTGKTNGVLNLSQSDRRPPTCFQMIETPREISFKEIVSATKNFSESHRVAELDFGTAYYGFIDNRHHVLIKRLGMKTCPALRARFSNELQNLGRLRHRNLVQLRGWCTEQGEMLVVYDYSADRLLSHLLFHHDNRKDKSPLPWRYRYSIIKSLASAILYLHEEWEEQVIHRNITSSAIILDPDLSPRLSSFALAEFLTRNEHGHHVAEEKTKSARGIFGYMSPEYMESGDATPEADIYSFGVVVLEVITGQMAADFRRPEVLLVRKIQEIEQQRRSTEEIADIRLNSEYDQEELIRLVKLGIECTRSDAKSRPKMRQIVSILDGNDKFLVEGKKESREEWRKRNASSLSLIKRIQALGIQ